ncbi:MAG: sulfatase activating formylglycine-generating enzyme [Psychrosphaera sp.]|jgi:formylglycine-generating enzyme required for sulfatase activity
MKLVVYLIITLLLISTNVQSADIEELQLKAKNTQIKWQQLQLALNSSEDDQNKTQKTVATLRAEYQQALTKELNTFDQLVTTKAQQEYQAYLAERVFEIEHQHHCKRMSSQKECEEEARITALDKAGKQGSSIIINSTTDITTTRKQLNEDVVSGSDFKEKTSMRAFTNISSYQVVESYKLDKSKNHERLWFIKISVHVSAKQNDYYYQQLVNKYKQRLIIHLSQSKQIEHTQDLQTTQYIETVGGIPFVMVKLPGGQFIMGSEQGEFNEQPTSVVQVKSFYIADTEVTKALYQQCIKSKHCNDKWKSSSVLTREEFNQPKADISWYDIKQEFLPWLNKKTGRKYRLPTEIEWEFAARSGSQSDYYYGDRTDQICLYANGAKAKDVSEQCDDGHNKKLAAVKQYNPNKFGLYDMLGNVAEWTNTCGSLYSKMSQDCSQAMIRGGSWYDQPFYLRTSSRIGKNKNTRLDTLGFRLAYSE